ncbi:MAG: hypothetical protein ABIP55_02890 [Tepidisphaeraceae bacterium]
MSHKRLAGGFVVALVVVVSLFTPLPRARAVESVHFGYAEANPTMTDAIRLSTRIGYAWWSLNSPKLNPENSGAIPYSYHDGYPNLIGTTLTAQAASDRWKSILDGNGDTYTGVSGAVIGTPTIILLDELSDLHKDTAQGPALKQALQIFTTTTGYNKNHIVIACSPAISMGSGVIKANYDDVIFCANNYCRWFIIEVYVTQKGYLTGYDPDETTYRGKGDTYLANRLTFGLRNWTTTMGVSASKVMPMFLISNRADEGGTNFYKFLNRCFWFTANGWYNAAHSGVDANVKAALRNGVGSYTWAPGTGDYQLITSATTRDIYHEKYIMWYSVGGNLAAHADGLAPLPPP